MRAVNLIPSDDRGGAGIAAGRSGGGVIVIAGLLAGLAVLALLYGLADHQISSNRSEVASLTARAQQAQTRAGELAPYTSFLQMREQRVQAVTTLVDSRFDWAQAFQELGRVLPAGKVSLGSIEGTVGSTAAATTPASSSASSSSTASGSSVTSATPPGSIPVFKLTGCAVSQAEVALMLERLRLINGVDEVSLQSSTQAAASGAGAGGGCAGGNPTFTAQITFDALPAIPASGTGAGTSTSTSTATASTSAATSSGATATSTPASTTTTTSTPAASAASTSSSGAVR